MSYPVGVVRSELGAAPGQKAQEDCHQRSEDETARNPAPKLGFNRRIDLFEKFHDPRLSLPRSRFGTSTKSRGSLSGAGVTGPAAKPQYGGSADRSVRNPKTQPHPGLFVPRDAS